MTKSLLRTPEIIAILSHSPSRIDASIGDLSDQELASRPEEGEWSPLELLGHLRACADVWGDIRIDRMLSEAEPTMRALNPMTWIRETDYYRITFRTSLAAFCVQREALLDRLRSTTPADWERGGIFTGGGAPRRYTVHTEADALARHERAHLKQIEKRCTLIRAATGPPR